jgi:ferredoxin like protein
MKIDERLALDAFTPDPEPHIVPSLEVCARCEDRPCISCCPGHLWALVEETGEMTVELAGCLECGTCLIVCPLDAVEWRHPCGGAGIRYRFG